MAMVTPVLLLVLGGIVDFGFLFRGWEVVTNAAREGARVGVLPSYSCDPATPDDVESRVEQYMAASGFTDTSDYEVDIDMQDVTTTAGTFNACVVVVTLTQDLPSLSVFGAFFGGSFGSVPVAASAVMRTEIAGAP
jgi:Flp pilus assembly protein TadG